MPLIFWMAMSLALSHAAVFPLGPFEPFSGNPVLRPVGDGWESSNLYNPAAIVVENEVILLYRAHGPDLVSYIGLAISTDGFQFHRRRDPVLSPEHDYERLGCEDPRITKVGDTFYLTYTGWDGTSALLCLATSVDLIEWVKHGPLFPDFNTFATVRPDRGGPWSKAGVIHDEPIAGLYRMWFGEGALYTATSPDLLHWTPASQQKPFYSPTAGSWDEDLVEIGAPPVRVGDDTLVFLTNGATVHADGSVRYQCGQIAVSTSDPGKVIARLDRPWLTPQSPEELSGLVSNVTFVEGLVRFHGRWLAYYGQSDTTLAVATTPPSERVRRGGQKA